MKKTAATKTTKPDETGGKAIDAYAKAQTAARRALCEQLRELIDDEIPNATSKVWHGSPVWFVGENPVVGYSVKASGVSLLFWNGQALGVDALSPVGKYGAAEAVFDDPAALDVKTLRRWLKLARTNVFDSKAFFAKLRARNKKPDSRS